MVSMVRQVRVNQSASSGSDNPGLHQVDLDAQGERVKTLVSGLNTAPQNEQGQISRDFILRKIRENYNLVKSKLARQKNQELGWEY